MRCFFLLLWLYHLGRFSFIIWKFNLNRYWIFSNSKHSVHILGNHLLFLPYSISVKNYIDCLVDFIWGEVYTHSKVKQKEELPDTSCPCTCTVFHSISIPYQSGIFVTTDESTLTHHYYSRFIVFIRLYS